MKMLSPREDQGQTRTDSMTETLRVLRISGPPVKRLKSTSKPILGSDSMSELEYRMSDHSISSTRIREMSPPKRKVPSSKQQKKMIMQIALHSDISSFQPQADIPDGLRSLYTNTPKERALVLYKPPSEFLPSLIANQAPPAARPPSRSSPLRPERCRRNSAPEFETSPMSSSDESMDI